MSSTATPGTTSPTQRARGRHPVVGVGVPRPVRGRAAARPDRPARRRSRSTSPPSAVELGGERGEPVGLVAAEVRDAAQPATARSASAATAATVGVSSPTSCRSTSTPASAAGPGARSARPVRRRPCSRTAPARGRIASPGWVVAAGQPGTVTSPPVTAAAARNTAALDRSGSIDPVPGRDRAGRDPPGVRLVRRRPRRRPCAASRTVISMCGSDGTGLPSWSTVTPLS